MRGCECATQRGIVCVFCPHRTAETGLDDPRGHTVHPYVTVSQLGSQGPGETQQRRLTHAVRTKTLSVTHTMNTCTLQEACRLLDDDETVAQPSGNLGLTSHTAARDGISRTL